MLLFSLIISNCEDRVLFVLIHLTKVLCHSFNSSGGSVLLISSSILSSCQVHVQFLPFTVGVLSKLYHSYSFLSRFNQSGFNSFLSIVIVIHSFATSKVHMVFLVSLFYRSALNCVQLCCVLSFNFSTSQGSWFHSLVEEATQFYLFSSFSFSLRCHPRSRDEILSQWWSVVTPQDRCFRRLPAIPSFAMCFFCACSFIFALHHVIMPSCHLIFKTQLNKLYGSSIHLNRGKGDFSL